MDRFKEDVITELLKVLGSVQTSVIQVLSNVSQGCKLRWLEVLFACLTLHLGIGVLLLSYFF